MNASITARSPNSAGNNGAGDTPMVIKDVSRVPATKPSDEDLLGQLGEKDGEALSILFRRYARIVRWIAYRALHDVAEADDLVQDVFLLTHRESPSFDRVKASARTWILHLAHRRAISRHRYLSSRRFYDLIGLDDMPSEQHKLPIIGVPAGSALEEAFGEAAIRMAFDELSINQRETLRLHFFEGYSLVEIARKLCQSRGNVKHHYFRGLEQLRKRLSSCKVQPQR